MQIISKITSKSSQQRYKPGDEKLFHSTIVQRSFGIEDDYVECHVYDINGELLNSDYDFKNYKPTSRDRINDDGTYKTIELDPGSDLINFGYREGDLTIQYNFFRKKIFSNINNNFFIKEISQDRTEIKVSSNYISNIDLETQVNLLIDEINNTPYNKDYLLNFGFNKCIVAINVALDKSEDFYNILFKLYEPLPTEISLKNTFWLVDEIIQAPIFELDLANYILENQLPVLRGPNFDINVNTQNSSLNYHSYNDLLTTSSFSSSYNQIFNILNQKGININVDYTDYSNFVNFSSVRERLENFKYKLQLIENYQSQSYSLNNILTSSAYINENQNIIKNKIDAIISKFDGYEYFLYYESGSKTWPKQNSLKPYVLYPSTSSYGTTWFNQQITSASYYDQENINNLEYTVPEFIRTDSQNSSYVLFLNMIGQHFDNIWIFIKSITDINLGDNKLTEGISKDLITDVLKSLGIKLYSSNSNINLFEYLIGSNQNNFKYKYSEPTGSYFTSVVTASIETLPKEDINKEILKRIYHNLPLLLKSKGTERGLRTLINCYGIPDTILRINEFGGSDKESGSLETVFNRFSYSTYLTSSGVIQTPWENLSLTNAKPNALEFRFKLSSSYNIPTQSLFEVGSTFKIELTKISGSSTNGSIVFKYAGSSTSFITLPYINNDWWSVLLNKSGNNYNLYVKNNIEDYLAWTGSASLSSANTLWNTSGIANFGGSGSIYFQEIRYWTEPVSESIFNKHVFNPESYEGNQVTSSYYTLGYRLSLGNNLLNISTSIHPNQLTQSFSTGTQLATIISGSQISQEEIYYIDSFKGGFVRVNDKIKVKNSNLITGSVLSPYIKLDTNTSSSSPDLHYVEVSLSPVNEINNDIVNQLGSFKIDNYIGDPAELYSSSYYNLTTLNREYFQKYLRSYNYYDYIRLIKFFDNSLFNIIKDFIPGRSKDITGITIESPILERNKVKHNKPNIEKLEVREANYNTASFSEDRSYYYSKISGNKAPFYTGEYSGSILNTYNYFNSDEYASTLFLSYISSSFTSSLIYNENDLTKEWSGSYTGSATSLPIFNDTSNPYIGTKNIFINAGVLSVNNFILTSPYSITLSNYNELEFYISKDDNLTATAIRVQFYSGSTAITQNLALSSSFGYNRQVNNLYQKVNIPISLLSITGSGTGFLSLRFNFSAVGGVHNTAYFVYTDYIRLLGNQINSTRYDIITNNYLNWNFLNSRNSITRQKLDGTYNDEDVLSPVQLQDSYDSLTSYQNSRYDGCKTTSRLYNSYSIGDSSYGKTAAIDKTVKKIGLFTQVHESTVLPKRNNISLIYLVDESGSLTELNKRNKNWCEVQNTFIAGDNLVISLFDNQKFSDQKTTDGQKPIFDSGYFYSPILYFQTCSLDPRIYFENLGDSSNLLAIANNFNTSSYFITGSSSIGFPAINGTIYGIFNREVQDNSNVFTTGTINTPPTYSVGEGGQYKVYGSFDLTISASLSTYTTWSLQLYKNGTLYDEDLHTITLIIQATGSTDGPWNILYSPYQSTITSVGIVTANKPVLLGSTTYPIGTQFRKWNTPLFKVGSDCSVILNPADSSYIWYSLVAASNDSYPGYVQCSSPNPPRWGYALPGFWEIPGLELEGASSTTTFTIDKGYTNSANAIDLNLNDKLSFQFRLVSATDSSFTASISEGSMIIGSLAQSTGYASTACPYFNSASFSSSIDEITFSSGISNFYGGNYLFVPNPLTGSENSLYLIYGDVDYPFSLKVMDIVAAYLSDGTYIESRIIRAYRDSSGLLKIQLEFPLSQTFKNDLATNKFSRFLLLSRINDETNVITRFKKRHGSTSYGFIIPSNLDKNMLNNIDKITEEVKLKLIDNGLNIDGGVF